MAFRKKAGFILKHRPDIAIIPECEHPDKLKFNPGIALPKDILWTGKNQHKGLGIFSYSDYKFRLHENYQPGFRNVLPITVTVEKPILRCSLSGPITRRTKVMNTSARSGKHYIFMLTC
jgi:hypothetical protein